MSEFFGPDLWPSEFQLNPYILSSVRGGIRERKDIHTDRHANRKTLHPNQGRKITKRSNLSVGYCTVLQYSRKRNSL